MAKPVRRPTNPYLYPHPTPPTSGESVSSKRIARAVGYNRRIRGPQFPVDVIYVHVDSPDCVHCQRTG